MSKVSSLMIGGSSTVYCVDESQRACYANIVTEQRT